MHTGIECITKKNVQMQIVGLVHLLSIIMNAQFNTHFKCSDYAFSDVSAARASSFWSMSGSNRKSPTHLPESVLLNGSFQPRQNTIIFQYHFAVNILSASQFKWAICPWCFFSSVFSLLINKCYYNLNHFKCCSVLHVSCVKFILK